MNIPNEVKAYGVRMLYEAGLTNLNYDQVRKLQNKLRTNSKKREELSDKLV